MDSTPEHKSELNINLNNINNFAEFTNTMSRIHDAGQRLGKLLACSNNKMIPLNRKARICSKICSTTSLDKNNSIEETSFQGFDLYDPVTAYKEKLNSTRSTRHNSCKSTEPTQLPTSSKETSHPPVDTRITFVLNTDNLTVPSKEENNIIYETAYAEKTTYCRPAVNIYKQDYDHKAVEKNTKLQVLVKRLALAREKEKQMEAWNNYINELKNKHTFYFSEPCKIPNIPAAEDLNSDIIIKDRFNRKYISKRSNLVRDDRGAVNARSLEENIPYSSINKPFKYNRNSFCMPISSQARLVLSDREKHKNKRYYNITYHPSWNSRDVTILGDKEKKLARKEYKRKRPSELYKKYFQCSKCTQTNTCTNLQINGPKKVQKQQNETKDNYTTCLGQCIKKSEENVKTKLAENIKVQCDQVLTNVEIIKQKVIQPNHTSNKKCCSLANIENKLDLLIYSVNTFMMELRSKKHDVDKTSTQSSCGRICTAKCSKAKSDLFGGTRNIICAISKQETRSNSTFLGSPSKRQDTIDEILYEEMNKSDRVKRDIDKLLKKNGSSCAVQMTIDVPTKEHSSELMDSACKIRQEEMVVEEIKIVDDNRMSMAGNADPLGLLALFRVSADTVKQFLSYMPHMDYTACLSRLQNGCSPAARVGIPEYMCNICDVTFRSPSQLSNHIQQRHNIGNPRGCCVCRHVIDNKLNRAGLFACEHCGKMFTRAYCRELHEQSCSNRIGSSDVRSSLTLLK